MLREGVVFMSFSCCSERFSRLSVDTAKYASHEMVREFY